MRRLKRRVSRVTVGEYRVLHVGKPRPIVLTLTPGDVIEFREFRRRERYILAADAAFRYAVGLHARQEAANRKTKKGVRNGSRN